MNKEIQNLENKLFGKQGEVIDAKRKVLAEQRHKNTPDRNFSWQELAANPAVSALLLMVGRETSMVSREIILDHASLFNTLLDYHDSDIGSIEPLLLSDGDTKIVAVDEILGYVFSLDNQVSDSVPGNLKMTDATSGMVRTVKAVDNKLRGVVFCTAKENQMSYDPTGGVSTNVSNERYAIAMQAGNFTFTSEGLSGEIYPIIPTRGFVDHFFAYLGDVNYSFNDLMAAIVNETRP